MLLYKIQKLFLAFLIFFKTFNSTLNNQRKIKNRYRNIRIDKRIPGSTPNNHRFDEEKESSSKDLNKDVFKNSNQCGYMFKNYDCFQAFSFLQGSFDYPETLQYVFPFQRRYNNILSIDMGRSKEFEPQINEEKNQDNDLNADRQIKNIEGNYRTRSRSRNYQYPRILQSVNSETCYFRAFIVFFFSDEKRSKHILDTNFEPEQQISIILQMIAREYLDISKNDQPLYVDNFLREIISHEEMRNKFRMRRQECIYEFYESVFDILKKEEKKQKNSLKYFTKKMNHQFNSDSSKTDYTSTNSVKIPLSYAMTVNNNLYECLNNKEYNLKRIKGKYFKNQPESIIFYFPMEYNISDDVYRISKGYYPGKDVFIDGNVYRLTSYIKYTKLSDILGKAGHYCAYLVKGKDILKCDGASIYSIVQLPENSMFKEIMVMASYTIRA